MPSRSAFGFSALIVAALGGVAQYFGSGPFAAEAGSNGLKMGLILGLVWLAYRDLARLPKWLLPALVVVALAMLKFRWLLLAVPVVALAGWLLYPRAKSGLNRSTGKRSRDSSGSSGSGDSNRRERSGPATKANRA